MREIDFTIIKIDFGKIKMEIDLLVASIKAYINGINRLYNK